MDLTLVIAIYKCCTAKFHFQACSYTHDFCQKLSHVSKHLSPARPSRIYCRRRKGEHDHDCSCTSHVKRTQTKFYWGSEIWLCEPGNLWILSPQIPSRPSCMRNTKCAKPMRSLQGLTREGRDFQIETSNLSYVLYMSQRIHCLNVEIAKDS